MKPKLITNKKIIGNMKHRFKPGDKVVCVLWKITNENWTGEPLIMDKIYTIRENAICSVSGAPKYFLEGIVNAPHRITGAEYGYSEKCFAPYQPPRIQYVAVAESLREQVMELKPSN
jgi:hypothetical protein